MMRLILTVLVACSVGFLIGWLVFDVVTGGKR